MENNPAPPANPWKLIMIGLRNWPILLLCGFAFGSLGVVFARLLPDKFTTTALLQIDTQARRPTGALGEMADLFQTDARAETETELIQSKSVIGAVVDSLRLEYQARSANLLRRILRKSGRMDLYSLRIPPRPPKSKAAPWTAVVQDPNTILLRDSLEAPVLKARKGEWTQRILGADTIGIRFDSLLGEPGEVFVVGRGSKTEVVNDIADRLKVVERGRKTGILEMRFTAGSPDKAQSILNAIASEYLNQNIQVRSVEARKSLDYLQQQMPVVRHHLDSLEEILKDYRFQKGTVDIGTETQAMLREKSDLDQQLLILEQRRQELLRLYREDHPTITSLDAQIRQIRKALEGTAQNAKRLPLTQQALVKLTRDIDVNTALYTSLLNNIQQLQVVAGGEAGNARIVDPAFAPTRPSGPSRKPVILAFLLVGLVIGYGFAFLRTGLNEGITDAAGLENASGLPVLGQIPLSNQEKKLRRGKNAKQGILATEDGTDLAIEALRSIRTGIDLTRLQKGNEVLCVTGLSVGDGKSFVASNLAALFALLGKRVLLIDADLRRGRLHETFGIKPGIGLAEYLKGEELNESPAKPTTIENLYLIPSGTYPKNPSELLSHKRFNDLLESYHKQVDLIIIDTPPLMLVSDALFSMKRAVCSLLVAESGAHKADDVQECLRRIRLNQIDNLAFILNKCDWASKGVDYYLKYGKYD